MSKTRQQMRTRLRILLNDPDGDKWDNDVLNELLLQQVDDYRQQYLEINPDAFQAAGGIAYTVGSNLLAIDNASQANMPDDAIKYIWAIRDVTQDVANQLKGFMLKRCSSWQEIAGILDQAPTAAFATHWFYLSTTSFSAGGVDTMKPHILIAPQPSTARTYVCYMSAFEDTQGAKIFGAEASTTALPTFAERCVLLNSALDARMMEQNPNTTLLEKQLTKAERDFKIRSKRSVDPVDEMDFDDSILY